MSLPGSDCVRILAVSHTGVWPVRSGAANRRLMILHALSEVGTVDLHYVGEVAGLASLTPSGAVVQQVSEQPVRRIRPTFLQRAYWLARPAIPYEMIEWATDSEERPPDGEYDVVWYFRPITLALAHGIRARTRVVDLDDLEDQKLEQELASGGRRLPLRQRIARSRNAGAWRRHQRAVASAVDVVTVCKDPDRQDLGVSNCSVVLNGFPTVPETTRDNPPTNTLIFVGLFPYEPNADAAEFFVRSVLPRIRDRVPGVRLRLVGRTSPRMRRLAEGAPDVEVVGEVDDLGPEYERAKVAIVPIRLESGTRVKILEAFARGVPVVSTRAGAAGLGAEVGTHLLLADSPEEFAEACVSLLQDDAMRSRLRRNANALYRSNFGQEAVNRAVHSALEAAGVWGALP